MTGIDLAALVDHTIREHRLFSDGDTVIVGLSAGADSTALAHLLAGLTTARPRLVAAHLDHCLRGEASDADARFAGALAATLGIPFELARVDVRELATRLGMSIEDAGRRARIEFLDRVREQWGATAVALGHHADDQAETVLMRLLRGSGATGLSGMSFRNRCGYVRPLLGASRSQIEDYLRQRNIPWRDDASNRDTGYLRNRIRHELLPLLETYNPAVRSRLITTAEILEAEDLFMADVAQAAANRCAVHPAPIPTCHIPLLLQEPPPIRRRVLRLMLARGTGSCDHFSAGHIRSLERLLLSDRPNAAVNLPCGLRGVREYDLLYITGQQDGQQPLPELPIPGPGTYRLTDGGVLEISADTLPPERTSIGAYEAFFDAAAAPFPWRVRGFRDGDRISPLGMQGSKKLKDLFIDAKVPPRLRRAIPLLIHDDAILWVCGMTRSRHAVIHVGCGRIVRVVYRPAGSCVPAPGEPPVPGAENRCVDDPPMT